MGPILPDLSVSGRPQSLLGAVVPTTTLFSLSPKYKLSPRSIVYLDKGS